MMHLVIPYLVMANVTTLGVVILADDSGHSTSPSPRIFKWVYNHGYARVICGLFWWAFFTGAILVLLWSLFSAPKNKL